MSGFCAGTDPTQILKYRDCFGQQIRISQNYWHTRISKSQICVVGILKWENINSSVWANGVYHMIDASYETEKDKQVETQLKSSNETLPNEITFHYFFIITMFGKSG